MIGKIFIVPLIFLIFSSWLGIEQAQAVIKETMMVYAKGNDPTPYYRIWDGSSWGAELWASAVSGRIHYIVLRFSRTRNEAILGTLDSTGDIRTQIWNGQSWSSTTLHTNIGTINDAYRGFDIAYEAAGDRALIVFNDANSASPSYRIWDGTSWSTKTSITVPTTGVPRWITLAANPLSASNEIAMMLIDSNVDVYGMVWTGSTWSNMGVTTVWDTTGSISTRESIDVAYEQVSGRAMFIWGDSVVDYQYYRIWDGSSLSGATPLIISPSGGVCHWVRLVPRPNSNELMYGCQDAGGDLNTRKWSGSGWDTEIQHPEHDGAIEDRRDRNFDIVWETYPGNEGKAWLVWGDGERVSRRQWLGTGWGTVTRTGDDTALVRLLAHPNTGVVFSLIYEDIESETDDIWESRLTGGGTTWSEKFIIWAGPTLPNPVREPLDIAVPRYSVILSISVSPSNWQVGIVGLGTVHMSTSDNKINVTNTGNVAVTLILQIFDEDDKDEWSHSPSKTGAGNNTYVLSGIFCATTDSPVLASFNETDSEDVLTTTSQPATSTKFAYTGGTANGVAVPVGEVRSLWLRLDVPTAVSGTFAYEQHTITVRISCNQP